MVVERGLRRPPQIKDPTHVIEVVHSRTVLFDADGNTLSEPQREEIPVYKITIESSDVLITDVLLRAISAVLHTWSSEVGNVAEQVLRAQNKWEHDVPKPEVKQPMPPSSGEGNG